MPDQDAEDFDDKEDDAKDDTEDDSDTDDDDTDDDSDTDDDTRVFSTFGIASTVLGLISVAALVLGGLIWFGHRDDSAEQVYLSRVMSAAADWTEILINMNVGNIDASLQRLHDGTVGQLNTDFEAAIMDYRKVVEKLQARSAARSSRSRSTPCTATWTPCPARRDPW